MEATIDREVMGPAFIRFLADFGPLILDRPLSKEAFMDLSNRFPELQIEREKDGKVIIMSPVKPGSGNRESIVITYLGVWWLSTRQGKTFSSSTGIELPDGATKSPDCAWVSAERLEGVAPEELEATYLKIVPDFVVEIRSESDRVARLKKKMKNDWMKNGVRLAWLIDPYQEKVYIYRENGPDEIISGFVGKKLTGEEVMPGMELPLDDLRIVNQQT